MKILAISGSIRANSTNASILLALKKLAPDGIEVNIFSEISEFPHFNPDHDKEGDVPPPAVGRLRAELAASSALVISTPEYAHGIPGVLKNALDWLVSCPALVGMPVGLMYGSASGGNFAQESLKESLRTMSARVIEGAIVVIPGVRTKIDDRGRVSDEQISNQLTAGLKALIDSARNQR